MPERLVRQCLEQLEADPKQYVTPLAIADLEEIRAALGYDKLNLWGGSYGTRVALEYLRRHGSHVRTVTLDGAAPATMKLPLSFVADGEAALEADAGRLRRAGALPQHLPGAARDHRRAAQPPLAPARAHLDPGSAHRRARDDPGERERAPLGASSGRSTWRRWRACCRWASPRPPPGTSTRCLAPNLEFANDISENLAVGMHLSVIASRTIARVTREDLDVLDASFFGARCVDDFVRACSFWPRGKLPADYYEPVTSDVPTLILSGGIDRPRPPRHGGGEAVARTLKNARHLVAPHLGHGVSLHGLRAAADRVLHPQGDHRGDRGQLPRAHSRPAVRIAPRTMREAPPREKKK
jgi:pimeloyl-ACP methyl ester carboxylesterase